MDSQWKMNNVINSIRKAILETVFPIYCLACQKDDTWLCTECLKKITIKNEQHCPICEKYITPQGRTCFDCRRKFSIDGLLVSTSYKEPLIAEAISLMKYRFVDGIAEPLGELILKAVKSAELPLPDMLIPVPLHKRRLRWRGFNQSLLLAKNIQASLTPGINIPLADDILLRVKYTAPQMQIKDQSARKDNIHQAFCINNAQKELLKNKYVWLIDDVATTGSTLFECATTLKKQGAKEVFGIVIARQEAKRGQN